MKFIIFLIIFALVPFESHAVKNFTDVSDTLSTSAPSQPANHSIQFTLTQTIPVGGKIVITPQSNAFNIPSELNFTDIDLLKNGVNQPLAASSGQGSNSPLGISVISGSSGSISIFLNDADSMLSGSAIIIKIGTNANHEFQGDKQIINPTLGSYKITLQSFNQANQILDRADAMAAIVEPVSLQATAPAPPAPPPAIPPISVGAGTTPLPLPTGAALTGYTSPFAEVALLKNGQIMTKKSADKLGYFKIEIRDVKADSYIFGVSVKDLKEYKTPTITIPLKISPFVLTKVDNIILPPTIDTSASIVSQGKPLKIFGYSHPKSEISISVIGETEIVFKTIVDKDGYWQKEIETGNFKIGNYSIKARAKHITGIYSSYSFSVPFEIAQKVGIKKAVPRPPIGDLNKDGRINLIDFSIMAYFWKRAMPLGSPIDLNNDRKLTLADFSILAYRWTG